LSSFELLENVHSLTQHETHTLYSHSAFGRKISPVRAAARKSASDESDKTALKALVGALPRLNILTTVSEERKRGLSSFSLTKMHIAERRSNELDEHEWESLREQ
jgi:hypothetical protein